MALTYRVTCTVEANHALAWRNFFMDQHIQDVLDTKCFTGYAFEEDGKDDQGRSIYSTEYYCESEAALNRYNEKYAPTLKADVMQRFAGVFTCTRKIIKL